MKLNKSKYILVKQFPLYAVLYLPSFAADERSETITLNDQRSNIPISKIGCFNTRCGWRCAAGKSIFGVDSKRFDSIEHRSIEMKFLSWRLIHLSFRPLAWIGYEWNRWLSMQFDKTTTNRILNKTGGFAPKSRKKREISNDVWNRIFVEYLSNRKPSQTNRRSQTLQTNGIQKKQ